MRWLGALQGDGLETDRWLLAVTLLLLGAGLAMVLSASSVLALQVSGTPYYFFVRQALFAGAGVVALLVLRRVDYHLLYRLGPALAVTAAGLMVLTLVPHVSPDQLGAHRWINLGPLGTLQPSELGKLAFAVFMARWVERRQGRLQSVSDGFLPFLIMTGAILALLILQRDMGTAIVTCAILVSIYFAGGGRKQHVAALLAALLGAFALLTLVESYRATRVATFLDPFKDPLGAGYQPTQALIGLGSGGLFGVGLGHSVQKFFWLPEAHTDFIFAIIGEETGLIGTTLILAGFVLLMARGYRAAMRAPDRFGVMLATGITTWIGFQALVNMATVTDTLPATGVPLPFISAGGTALTITLAAIGVLLNVAAHASADRPTNRRRIDATADLGRRNWRTSLASIGRRPRVPRRAPGS
jgi:cell division protein FtsW